MRFRGFRSPQEQKTAWLENMVKNGQDLFLQCVVQINHHIAATDQVEAGKKRGLVDPLNGKKNQPPPALVSPGTTLHPGGKTPLPFGVPTRHNIGGGAA